jgi:hypothetical protein
MTGNLDPARLTPGVLDGSALHAFKTGACGALAIALHEVTGWPIVAITDSHNVHNGKAGGGSALHWAVKRPDGKIVDVDGAHSPEDLVAEYHDDADEGLAAIGVSSRADVVEWYVESQGEPIPVKLAYAFVDAVLLKAGEPVATAKP